MDKNFASGLVHVNGLLSAAKGSLETTYGEFVKGSCDVPAELDKLAAENSALDGVPLLKFLHTAEQGSAKKLYADFRFWNEQLTTVISAAQHLASESKVSGAL